MATDIQLREAFRTIQKVFQEISAYEGYSGTNEQKRDYLPIKERDGMLAAFKIIVEHIVGRLPV